MIKIVLLSILFSLTLSAGTYLNPVQGIFDSPDPGVIRDVDGTYYAATTGKLNSSTIFPIWKSSNLATFTLYSKGFQTPPVWTDGGDFWAPQIHIVGKSYNIYYTARTKAHKLCIGVAYSNHIAGPYIDIDQPLWQHDDLGIIDATFFKDPKNSTNYLIYKTDGNAVGKPTQIYAIQLSSDGREVVGSNRMLLIRDTLSYENGIVQAPWVIFQNNFYYLFYSSCGYNQKCYSVSVARSKNLLDSYEKYNKTMLQTRNPQTSNSMEGPGHCSVVKGPGGNWAMVYHAWPHNGLNTKRLLMLDQIQWTADKWPFIGSPSEENKPIP